MRVFGELWWVLEILGFWASGEATYEYTKVWTTKVDVCYQKATSPKNYLTCHIRILASSYPLAQNATKHRERQQPAAPTYSKASNQSIHRHPPPH